MIIDFKTGKKLSTLDINLNAWVYLQGHSIDGYHEFRADGHATRHSGFPLQLQCLLDLEPVDVVSAYFTSNSIDKWR